MKLDYPKFVYQLDGTARLLATAQDAATLPGMPWFEDPGGREPFPAATEPATPEPEPAEAPKPRSHKKAAKD